MLYVVCYMIYYYYHYYYYHYVYYHCIIYAYIYIYIYIYTHLFGVYVLYVSRLGMLSSCYIIWYIPEADLQFLGRAPERLRRVPRGRDSSSKLLFANVLNLSDFHYCYLPLLFTIAITIYYYYWEPPRSSQRAGHPMTICMIITTIIITIITVITIVIILTMCYHYAYYYLTYWDINIYYIYVWQIYVHQRWEGTVDWDAVALNCSTGNWLSSFDKRISSKSSNREIRARRGLPTVSYPLPRWASQSQHLMDAVRYIHICTYIYIYNCMCIYIYIYIYIYKYTPIHT